METISSRSRAGRWWLAAALLCYCGQALIGIEWGLPTRAWDRWLFGGSEAWSGQRIAELAGGQGRVAAEVAADVDVNPLDGARGTVVLNRTPPQQAEIYRRYRLYTQQPDEMITMMALSGMRPGALQLDPKLYQYGGLYIYPVGGLIGAAGATGLITVRSDLTYYLDHPSEFGKFYVTARLYAAAWGVILVLGVYGIGRRMGGPMAGGLAAIVTALLPVVACMSHEAKPHLPGAALMIAAVWFALAVMDRPTRWRWMGLFVCCGAAFGMVLSSLPIFVLIPLAAALHAAGLSNRAEPREAGRRFDVIGFIRLTIIGCAVAMGVYLVTNPYVAINAIANPAVLRSNFGNSLAMYAVSRIGEGFLRVVQLTAEGATWPVLIGGVVGCVYMVRRVGPAAWLVVAPGIVFAAQFILIGAGKPDEYGRFGIFYECLLAIGLAYALSAIATRVPKWLAGVATAVVLAWCLWATSGYLWSFGVDAAGSGSRAVAAQAIRSEHLSGLNAIAVAAEPAPYSCPPLDFADVRVVLCRKGSNETVLERIQDWRTALEAGAASEVPKQLVAAVDDPGDLNAARLHARVTAYEVCPWFLPPSRISWANKPIVIIDASND